jgi:outer membrane immunogenic protein
MKKLFLATTLFAALGSGCAVAADMAVRAAPAPVRPLCAQFGGFYIGVQGGSVKHDSTWNDRDAWANNEVSVGLPLSVNSNEFGWHVGPQIGWNWQSGCTVFGVMADWSWSDANHSIFATDGQPGAALDTLAVDTELKWFGTARTRAGVVVDNLLLYVSGGFGFAKIGYTATVTDNIGGVFVSERFSSDKTRVGWAAGVGTEWAFAPNWTLMSEFVYIGFQNKGDTFSSTFAVNNGNSPSKRFDYQDSLWVGRFGINYRW